MLELPVQILTRRFLVTGVGVPGTRINSLGAFEEEYGKIRQSEIRE